VQNYQQKRGDESIERLGANIQIIRNGIPLAYSKAILEPMGRYISFNSVKSVREIYVKSDDDIQTGDYLLDIKRSQHFVFLGKSNFVAENDTIAISGLAAMCNQDISIYRNVEKPSGAGGVRAQFELIHNNIPASLEFLRGGLNEGEMGFFKSSTHRMYIPAYFGIAENDRIKIGADNLRVDSVDTFTYEAVAHCAVTRDRRLTS
jgi:hypothetical protein